MLEDVHNEKLNGGQLRAGGPHRAPGQHLGLEGGSLREEVVYESRDLPGTSHCYSPSTQKMPGTWQLHKHLVNERTSFQ